MPSLRPVAAAALLLGGLLGACSDDDGSSGSSDGGDSEVLGPADEGIDGVQAIRVYYSDPVHTDGIVDYELRPPPGGMHNDAWWSCGFYDEVLPDEQVLEAIAVHIADKWSRVPHPLDVERLAAHKERHGICQFLGRRGQNGERAKTDEQPL